MKITKHLAVWAEWAAQFWNSYWLLIVGSGLLFGSVLLKWIEFPFSNNLSGIQLSLSRNSGLMPHLSLLSFGVVGAVVLLVGLLWQRFFTSALGLAGAVLLTLCVLTPAHIAFKQPTMLRRLTDELDVIALTKAFTREVLPQNYGAVELVPRRLVLYTAWGRFLAAWSFLRLGWYCFALGGLLVFAEGIRRLPGGRALTGLMLLCLPIGAFVVVLIPPLIGQHYFAHGAIAKARGRNQEAIADYRKAMRWDAWHAQDIDLYSTIGQLQEEAGIDESSPERHISRAVELRDANEFDPALFEFSRAMEAGGALEAAARRESAQTRIDLGLALYDAGGVGGALASWQQALADDPTQTYALFYLARGYYDIGRYEAGVEAVKRLAKIIPDHTSMLGDVYSLAADCYAKLGRDADARHYYNLSLSADAIENYWALTGLIGQ
ncbi:MAG: tetratricopeptide repeat protein [Chthoniobacterales bacterium]|nr:tetratricopeptide repeat protein [Chthoniobacterales bacterium]